MSDGSNDDLKAKMREALERKNKASHPSESDGRGQGGGKAHGPEVAGGAAPKIHRRKAGGGGS
ncbi:MAG TPA: DUF5302 domain-containing protein [Nocardioides sp.]|jgi:hypothetical protein